MSKAAIVTGASSGIGLAISRVLCEKGYEVYGFGRDFAKEQTREFVEQTAAFHPVEGDLLEEQKLCDAVKEITKMADIEVLVNAAGVGHYGLHEELTPKKIQALVRTNLEIPLLLTNRLLRVLKKNHGYIINISSVTAKQSSPHGCAYAATKAGLSSFGKSLFEEARKYGVKVTTIHPDMTDTNLYRDADFTCGEEPEVICCRMKWQRRLPMCLTSGRAWLCQRLRCGRSCTALQESRGNMRVTIAQTLQHYEKKNLPKDICAGIIIMAVSIPISMGYAQIAGLPAVYGLYGSVFPILLFALFSTSPQFIFGVDAAPAALIGGALIDLHIESGSEAALKVVPLKDAITISLSVAVVIMAETLLAENNFAQKNRYRINDNQELLAFSLGNFAAALTGCCPINGSVSRTAMGEQYQGKTQLTGIVAGISMMILLLCGTGFIGFLPVPVLTAIVISALLGATEFKLAVRLWKVSRTECLIFFGAFFGVLLLGTINGVLIGIMLSFTEMIIRTAKPARCFLGIQTGHSHFRDLKESSSVHAVEHVVIYRFSSNLCFANVSVLQKDIEDAIREDTRAVILDAGGIGSIDITAADCLERLYGSLKEKGIRFYMTEHIAEVNEQLRRLGLGYMVEEGCVRRTIHIALKDMGIRRPYPLEGGVDNVEKSASRKRADNRVQEFVWAFGSEAEQEMEKQIARQIAHLTSDKDVEELIHGRWSHMEALDEDEWLEHLEEHLKEIVNISGKDEETLAKRLEEHRQEVHDRIAQEHPELAERFRERRHLLDEHLRERRPEVYELVIRLREKKDQA